MASHHTFDLELLGCQHKHKQGQKQKGPSASASASSLRAVLARHEAEAGATSAVLDDVERYARFLEQGLAILLGFYVDPPKPPKVKVD